jgi:hypothetical protein
MAGPVQEISDRFEASMLNRANDENEKGPGNYLTLSNNGQYVCRHLQESPYI